VHTAVHSQFSIAFRIHRK